MISKRSQITIFIILALIVVVTIGIYFGFRSNLISGGVPRDFEEVYNYYISCVEEEAFSGAQILGMQAGFIETPDFNPGSVYMPFSSQLNLLGNSVPYWYYISGNGVVKEQVPTLEKMESQLGDFLRGRIGNCDFSSFEKKGFKIFIGPAEEVKAKINKNDINVDVKQSLYFLYGEESFQVSKHSTKINSNIGRFYELAVDIYENQKETMFLENYGIDILRLYAPVDGTEISCSPKIWSLNRVRGDLILALEANIPAIKIEGDYYNLKKPENKYFVRKLRRKADANVNFMYVRDFPIKMEAWPSEEGILKADPVGLQEGLGMLGFCYVTYHYVYDFAYPVLIQIFSGEEVFQFPVVVYIEKNKPREGLDGESLPNVVPELCKNKLTDMSVYTYNKNLEPVLAEVSFKCFDTNCYIGRTEFNGEDAILTAKFPQCVNGFVTATANGYESGKIMISSLEQNVAMITLNKKYKLNIEARKLGREIEGYSVISFTKDDKTETIVYPEQKEIELSEGQYSIKAYSYSDSDISLEGSSTEKCVSVPKSGFMSIFGATEEKCFTMDIPSQTVGTAISGGGILDNYISEAELMNSRKLIINIPSFGVPSKLEDLQINYNNVETSRLDIEFEK